ncbi:hypothetical protein [Candidatus Methylobacter favarea]|uniref:hypothetical protein n=1 Tax=Candidatus Methylobacter favarea TaxID=2707345 RepID=UPI00157DD903|nr:hypothetical protein [Candidatus Methylobacter favarea]
MRPHESVLFHPGPGRALPGSTAFIRLSGLKDRLEKLPTWANRSSDQLLPLPWSLLKR